ncbi:reverse transcriptase domain-containing protein [Microbacterium sp. NPDC057650]|uniref:reverse transcriptase domain-containing protein n=1 Tax=unclassified Microbacterium TaxID=2609290 RepID=UPI00366F8644
MKLSADLLKRLDLSAAATQVTTEYLDRFPVLISDRCLADSTNKLVRLVASDFSSGTSVSTSTLSMPRKGFGPRPVTVLSARDRVLYEALVNHLRPSLAAESRAKDNWVAFKEFGLSQDPDAPKYVVSLDIASMYEYVDHQVLKRELLVQTLERPPVEALIDLLGEAFGFARAIPQMMSASDLLGDVYLGMLERDLLRYGYHLARYADDFRVLATSWGEAHRIIEHAAEAARSLGLVLSSEKTTVRLASTLLEEEAGLQDLVDKYFKEARADLTVFDDLMDWYGEANQVEIDPEDSEAMQEAFRRVLHDWAAPSTRSSIPTRLTSKAIRSLGAASERVGDDILRALIDADPLKLSSVISYFNSRATEADANLRSVKMLTEMERQSPWAKIWLLTAVDTWSDDDSADAKALTTWASAQITDEHEVVRAEAAWVLARSRSLEERGLGELFGRATRTTRPGLAAALGRLGVPPSNALTRSIVGASPIHKEAYEWGQGVDAPGSQ